MATDDDDDDNDDDDYDDDDDDRLQKDTSPMVCILFISPTSPRCAELSPTALQLHLKNLLMKVCTAKQCTVEKQHPPFDPRQN